jgi:phytoene desaturase
MNHADYGLGTWHPKGGMYEIVKAMKKVAEDLGVRIHTSSAVAKINVNPRKAKGIHLACNGELLRPITCFSGADYHHSETLLGSESYRQYSRSVLEQKNLCPFIAALLCRIQQKARSKILASQPVLRHRL